VPLDGLEAAERHDAAMKERLRGLRARRVRGLPLSDVVLAVLATTVAFLQALLDRHPLPNERGYDVLGLALIATSTAAIAGRRRRPVGSFCLALGMSSAAGLAGYPGTAAGLFMLLQLYSVGALTHRRLTVAVTALTAVVVAFTTWVDIAVYQRYESDAVLVIGTAFFVLAPALVGDVVRVNRQRAADQLEAATRTERLRRLEAERALVEERARIAREIHDVVAHHVSGIVLHAGAAERQAQQGASPPVHDALHRIRDSGAAALEAMRGVVVLLRRGEDEAGRRPQPTLAELEDLVARARSGGQAVTLTVTGVARTLPEHLEVCAYRVVQEALTNAARYAPGSEVSVVLDYGAAVLAIRVLDHGVASPYILPVASMGAGMGLAGMRERVTAAGGRLDAGPEGAGWSVRADVPVPVRGRP
jgi:signal transduction histidine kinase